MLQAQTQGVGPRHPTTQIRKPRKLFFSKRCYCVACLLSSL